MDWLRGKSLTNYFSKPRVYDAQLQLWDCAKKVVTR